MQTKTKILSVAICVSGLTACSSFNSPSYPSYQTSNLQGTQIYPEGYEGSAYYSDSSQGKKPMAVPESYHVGAYHSPTPHTDRDREWVNSQNPQSYTIELADGDKAATVAKTLYEAPKNERMAEIKYLRDGKTYYKGLYGSYPSKEAAEQALSALPADVKQSASVKEWNAVQGSAGQ